MSTVTISADGLEAVISTKGGLVTRLVWDRDGTPVPLLYEAPASTPPTSGCYPLVPFGNRIGNNRFLFGGRRHELRPNTRGDRHYLHGDGWLTDWTVREETATAAAFGYTRTSDAVSPYEYEARQDFEIAGGAFRMKLAVTHRGAAPLPYGLGWHPYFPLTPRTTLEAAASRFWTEAAEWLPGEPASIPEDLDFSQDRILPQRWINNGFEGWSGTATIRWPERGAQLTLSGDPIYRHAFLFVPDVAFDPSYRHDHFCFEPMTHLADGHNMADLGGLCTLGLGETLSGGMTLRPTLL